MFLFPMTVKLAAYMSSRAGLRVDMKVKVSEIYCCSESRDLPPQWGLYHGGRRFLHSTPLCSVPVEMTVGRAAYRKKDCEEMILIFSQSLLF